MMLCEPPFIGSSSHPVQVVHRKVKLSVKVLGVSQIAGTAEPFERARDSGHAWLDVRRAPLMRLQVTEDRHSASWRARLQIHHLIQDQDSTSMMLEEVLAFAQGKAETLSGPVSFRNHVAYALTDSEPS